MPSTTRKRLAEHRRRQSVAGVVRLEVRVSQEDVALVRSMALALADPARAAKTRATLRTLVEPGEAPDLKVLLASAPLEGVPLERDRDTGHDVDLWAS
ncbi:MAG: hypothetical protein KDG89_01600 [Geminicoccaceae bacterium]|nr:hypothetical protein [Geminicoccaceae bacterium]